MLSFTVNQTLNADLFVVRLLTLVFDAHIITNNSAVVIHISFVSIYRVPLKKPLSIYSFFCIVSEFSVSLCASEATVPMHVVFIKE